MILVSSSSDYYELSWDSDVNWSETDLDPKMEIMDGFGGIDLMGPYIGDLSHWNTKRIKMIKNSFNFPIQNHFDYSKWDLNNVEVIKGSFANAFADRETVARLKLPKLIYVSDSFNTNCAPSCKLADGAADSIRYIRNSFINYSED